MKILIKKPIQLFNDLSITTLNCRKS